MLGAARARSDDRPAAQPGPPNRPARVLFQPIPRFKRSRVVLAQAPAARRETGVIEDAVNQRKQAAGRKLAAAYADV